MYCYLILTSGNPSKFNILHKNYKSAAFFSHHQNIHNSEVLLTIQTENIYYKTFRANVKHCRQCSILTRDIAVNLEWSKWSTSIGINMKETRRLPFVTIGFTRLLVDGCNTERDILLQRYSEGTGRHAGIHNYNDCQCHYLSP